MNEALRQTVFDIWRILTQGGWVMAAIFAAGQLGWFLILERWWHYRKMDGQARAFLVKASRAPKDPSIAIEAERTAKGLFGKVAKAIREASSGGQEAMVMRARETLHEYVPALSKHLGTLAVLAGVAPLLGLAGTVIGIMQTFKVITLYGAGNPSMMAGGIAQALMVTEAGLVVAFPMLICHDHLQKRADAIEDECVAGATLLIRKYAEKGTAA
ncbi:MAG: MotA/TolQ/ExbB proton channel family protein [Fibrobacteres bacterium]|nr:MotA/TolQ/ExbB proton channel family protein [Fibrobacterota bacterium]